MVQMPLGLILAGSMQSATGGVARVAGRWQALANKMVLSKASAAVRKKSVIDESKVTLP
jgi:hypothetical protein